MKGLRSLKWDRYVSSQYMKRRSFLQPTSSTGVLGQKRRISGNHIALQLRSDFGLPIEKHSSTTSDLGWKIKSIKTRCFQLRARESYNHPNTALSAPIAHRCFCLVNFEVFLYSLQRLTQPPRGSEREFVASNVWSIKATNEKGLRQQWQRPKLI